jgi:hypothetical protein
VPAKLKEMEVSFETPSSLFGVGLPKLSWKGKLVPSDAEQRLAWGLYVELTTRIAIAGLGQDEGSLREALASYHSLFRFTRERLHEVGPQVGRPRGGSSEEMPIAGLVLWMLNGIVRPLLARWHPRLARHEEARPDGVGPFAHEAAWAEAEELRRDLAAARDGLEPFARLFETVCDIRPSLIPIRAAPAQADAKGVR